jgi:predicted transposase YdaD
MTANTNNEKSPVAHPHDKLVRRLLTNVATAREVLEVYLPPEVRALVDLNYLERQPDTFVDSQHRMHEVDILFKTRFKKTKKDAYIWFLIEQQRDPDVWLPLRSFCYIAVIWDNLRKRYKSRSKSVEIPFIYPLIISNASKPYHHSLSLRDMIKPEEAKPLFDNLFKTPLQLIDLAAIADEEFRTKLQEQVRAQALLLSLKHVFDKDLPNILETLLFSPFKQLDEMGYRDDVADLLYYLYNEGNLTDSAQFWSFLHRKFSPHVEEKVMTLGQQAVQQAVQQAEQRALQQGAKENSRETALRMLDEQLDIKLISKVTQLSQDEIKRLARKKN